MRLRVAINEMHQPTRHNGESEKRTTLTRGRLDAGVVRCLYFLIIISL